MGAAFRSVDTIRFSFGYRIGNAGMSAAGLSAGGVYYINFRNLTGAGAQTCPIDDCRMRGAVPN